MSDEEEDDRMELKHKIKEYLAYAGDLETATEVRKLVREEKYDELKKIMMKRLNFGTAGIRGKMGPGYGSLNDLVVIQTAQGLAGYLEATVPDTEKKKGIVIGYDQRHNSVRFAHLITVSFILKHFKVYLFSRIVPTPFIPYSVKKLECLLGIMVTASHNPKEYNGIKIYGPNGAQISETCVAEIQEKIIENLAPWPDAMDTSVVWTSPDIFDPFVDVSKMYYDDVKANAFVDDIPKSALESLKITFTSLHGVGHFFLKKGFQTLNFENYFPVEEQMRPDPEFSTVLFPNPEEQKCFECAILTAEENNCELIFAVDPDADRFRMAELIDGGRWYIFSGNEIAALLGSWLWENLASESKDNPTNCCMISSTVSSKILKSIAKKEGFKFYETLTGFKWIANKADDCIKEGMDFVFGFEESIGFMCGPMVLDKDGIHTSMQMLRIAAHIRNGGKEFSDLLRNTYQKYGFHYSHDSYFICDDSESIKLMFYGLRNFGGASNTYPDKLENGNESYPVVGIRDLTTGYDSTQPDNQSILPSSSSTEMITFFFENDIEVTLRTSGTEPKVKYYSEIIKHAPDKEWNAAKLLLHEVMCLVIYNWIQPEKYGFIYPPVTD